DRRLGSAPPRGADPGLWRTAIDAGFRAGIDDRSRGGRQLIQKQRVRAFRPIVEKLISGISFGEPLHRQRHLVPAATGGGPIDPVKAVVPIVQVDELGLRVGVKPYAGARLRPQIASDDPRRSAAQAEVDRSTLSVHALVTNFRRAVTGDDVHLPGAEV